MPIIGLLINIAIIIIVIRTIDTIGTIREEQRELAKDMRRLEAKVDALAMRDAAGSIEGT
jgi:uncharacterized protein YoxC